VDETHGGFTTVDDGDTTEHSNESLPLPEASTGDYRSAAAGGTAFGPGYYR
jgi:hypothetical protein